MARMLFLRDLDVDIHLRCLACGHGGVLPRGMLVRRFGQNYPVLSIAPHYRCSRCDSRDTESRPGPMEHHPVIDETGAAADPSFDASLAALQGLLASVRDPGKGAAPSERSNAKPSFWDTDSTEDDSADDGSDEDAAPPFRSFAVPEPDRWDDDPDDDRDDEAETLPEAVQDASHQDAFSEAESKHAFRPLEDLVADGPADEDAEPLWEPVSLADLAARSGDDGISPFDEVTEAGEPDEPPFDETLDAMRRFFAEAELADEDAARPPAILAEDAEGEGETEDEDDAEPAVFSHKALVRRDFEADVDEDTSDADAFDDGDDDELSGERDDEPTEEEILAFAIRDPEKISAPPPRVERAIKLSAPPPAAPPPADEEEEGFDRTLAALRSMIEEAASEPKVVPVRRKTRPPAEPLFDATEEGDRPAELPPKEPPPVKKTSGAKAAKAPAKTAGSKRSAQEREIEEAMKALGGLDDDDAAVPEAAPSFRPVAVKPAQPPVRSGKPKLDLVRDDSDAEPPAPAPPPPAEKTGAGESDASPLSKTIAALRGMLELDGRRKR